MSHFLAEGDTAKCGEGNEIFNFEEWLIQNNLLQLQQCFFENNMTTINALRLDGDNFIRLMTHQKVLDQPHFITKIVNAINNLHLQQEHQQTEPQLVFMTETEHNIFSMTQDYMDELSQFERELSSDIEIALEQKKKKNANILKEYKQNNLSVLDKMEEDIDKHFMQMFDALKRKQNEMKSQIHDRKEKVNQIEIEYITMIQALDKKMQNVFAFIQNGKKYYNDSIKKYKQILQQHPDTNLKFNVNSTNTKRETAICNVGQHMNKTHDLNYMKPEQNISIFRKFIDTDLYTNDKKSSTYSLKTLKADNIIIEERNDCVQQFIKSYSYDVYNINDEFIICDGVPPFIPHMKITEAAQLQIGDVLDHMDCAGRFYPATIMLKYGADLKIHYDGYGDKCEIWSNYQDEIHRFAVIHSISNRAAYMLKDLCISSSVNINSPMHPGWRNGIVCNVHKGQIKVAYVIDDVSYSYWVHVDDVEKISPFRTRILE